MKGQLFLLTLFVLAGLITGLSVFLSGFTQPDLSLTFQKDDPYYLTQFYQLYQRVSSSCSATKLEYLKTWIKRQELPGIVFQIKQTGDCDQLNVSVQLLGSRSNTTAEWIFK